MPKPADYFAPAVLGKMLEDKLRSPQERRRPASAPIEKMAAGPEPEGELVDIDGLPPVRGRTLALPEPLPVPRPRFVRGASADRWEPK